MKLLELLREIIFKMFLKHTKPLNFYFQLTKVTYNEFINMTKFRVAIVIATVVLHYKIKQSNYLN